MISYPAHRIPFRVLGIDPGTHALGVAVLDLYLDDHSVELVDARTFNAGPNLGPYKQFMEYHAESYARLLYMGEALTGYIEAMRPNGFCSESPFMGRFANAHAALNKCLLVIHQSIIQYDPFVYIHTPDPMTVKAAVGVSSKGYRNKAALGKEFVRAAVLKLPIGNPNGVVLDQLDEHSIDAIAVAMARIKAMLAT